MGRPWTDILKYQTLSNIIGMQINKMQILKSQNKRRSYLKICNEYAKGNLYAKGKLNILEITTQHAILNARMFFLFLLFQKNAKQW